MDGRLTEPSAREPYVPAPPAGAESTPPVYVAPVQDAPIVAALRSGDEDAFADLLRRYNASLLRIARTYVPSWAVAEEVVQETWLAVLEGLDRFEGRSSLKTWIFRILVKRAIKRGERERRTVPFSALIAAELDQDEVSVDPTRFLDASSDWPGHWASPPREWNDVPDEQLLRGEIRRCIDDAVKTLPPGQRSVLVLRDVEGWSSGEVCELLDLSEANQRVLLHRARTKVRAALARYLGDE